MVSIFKSTYDPTLSCAHEFWVMTDRMRSQIQAAEISVLRRVAELSLRDRLRSSEIQKELGLGLLLLCVEVVQMPPG